MNNKGIHAILDFTSIDNLTGLNNEIATNLIEFMIKECKKVGIKVLGHQLEIFDGIKSPPGFASVILLDESHMSAHCYSDDGMLAVDVFTCGDKDRGIDVARSITKYITEYTPYKLAHENIVDRFIMSNLR